MGSTMVFPACGVAQGGFLMDCLPRAVPKFGSQEFPKAWSPKNDTQGESARRLHKTIPIAGSDSVTRWVREGEFAKRIHGIVFRGDSPWWLRQGESPKGVHPKWVP